MDNSLEVIKNALLNAAFTGTPLGVMYSGLDTVLGGKLPGAVPTPEEARPLGSPKAGSAGEKTYWAGKDYGYQSPGSYKEVTGSYPKGYKPPQAPSTSTSQTGGIPPWSPPPADIPPAPTLPAPTTNTTIPQTEDKMPRDILEILKGQMTPENIQKLEDIRTAEFLKRGLFNALVSQRKGEQTTRRRIEEENIRAWRDMQVAKTQANAAQATALASAIWSSMQFQGGNPVLGAYEKALSGMGNLRLKA